MKRLLLFSLLVTLINSASAQAVTSVHQDFNAACATSAGFPSGWIQYTPSTVSFDPQGVWHCDPVNGRSSTPGIVCTGQYGSINHLDTSYLISPLLDIHSYAPGHIYLNFDTKTSILHNGGRLEVLAVDTIPLPTTILDLTPVFGIPDSSDWVTHQADLTSLESHGTFYLAFRYSSSTTTGSIWYLDNINTTTVSLASLGISTIPVEQTGITISGDNTTNQISFSYNAPNGGIYQLEVYDMIGRRVYMGQLNVQHGIFNYTINDLNLHQGMYVIKLGNSASYTTAKILIH